MGKKSARFRLDIATVADAISGAFNDLAELAQEMQDWFDNMPENLQGSSKGDEVSTAADELGNVGDEPDIPGCIAGETLTYSFDTKAKSRAARRDNALNAINAAIEFCQDYIGELDADLVKSPADDEDDEREVNRDAVQELLDELETARDAAESVEFPGMY